MKIPYIKQGERVPTGLSRYSDGYRLKLPIFAWVRRGYMISQDQFANGLWRLDVCLRTELSGFALHWGWHFISGTLEAAA